MQPVRHEESAMLAEIAQVNARTSPLPLGFALTALVAVTLLGGCGPKYPDCATDAHCKAKGEFCVDKKCAQCREASQCPNASTDPCVTCDKGACGRKAGCCANNLDCKSGQKCSETKCVAQCGSDQDCPAGQSCDERGACIAAVAGCTGDDDCQGGLRCQQGRCVNAQGECEITTVHFDYNDSQLSTDAQDAIGANVKCMKEKKMGRRIILEGHCDERGTDAYNLELGNRRARAVRRFLAQISPKLKLKTVSYGKTRPVCQQAGEGCWNRNRRVEFRFKK